MKLRASSLLTRVVLVSCLLVAAACRAEAPARLGTLDASGATWVTVAYRGSRAGLFTFNPTAERGYVDVDAVTYAIANRGGAGNPASPG